MKAVHNNDLERAKKLADAADAVTMRYYLSSKLEISTKPDASPDTATRQQLKNFNDLTAPVVTKGDGFATNPNLDREMG
jgi:hypothetical protein